eukprot:scaffold89720_cov64-Phaeocystis_antarctica.AAC.1
MAAAGACRAMRWWLGWLRLGVGSEDWWQASAAHRWVGEETTRLYDVSPSMSSGGILSHADELRVGFTPTHAQSQRNSRSQQANTSHASVAHSVRPSSSLRECYTKPLPPPRSTGRGPSPVLN